MCRGVNEARTENTLLNALDQWNPRLKVVDGMPLQESPGL
jgi:hypothetical protein